MTLVDYPVNEGLAVPDVVPIITVDEEGSAVSRPGQRVEELACEDVGPVIERKGDHTGLVTAPDHWAVRHVGLSR